MMPIIIQLVCGLIGGNVAGGILKNQSLGTLGNSLAGIVGGGLGGQILAMLGTAAPAAGAAATGGLDMSTIIGSLASGGVGGGVLMAVVGVIKNMMSNKA